MELSSKILTESTGEKIVKIGQYLAKIWTKYNSLVFLAHPVYAGRIRMLSVVAEETSIIESADETDEAKTERAS